MMRAGSAKAPWDADSANRAGRDRLTYRSPQEGKALYLASVVGPRVSTFAESIHQDARRATAKDLVAGNSGLSGQARWRLPEYELPDLIRGSL